MRNLYLGDIKKMYISKLELRDENINNLCSGNFIIHYGEKVVEKNADFYKNFFDKKVNFRYDNYLLTREEAKDNIIMTFLNAKNDFINLKKKNPDLNNSEIYELLSDIEFTALFVDYDELKEAGCVSNKVIANMKKMYKNSRKK